MDNQPDIMAVIGHGSAESAFSAGAGFIPLFMGLVVVGLYASYLARKKGYSGTILIWAWVPVLNIYGLMMFMGLPDLVVRARIDALAAKLAPPSSARNRPDEPEAG